MFINRNTHILTDEPCDTCKGTGKETGAKLQLGESAQDAPPTEKCRRCKGTGQKLIGLNQVFDFINQELAKRLR